MWVRSLGWEDSPEKEVANYSSVFAWEMPWTEEPGWLQPIGLQRVENNLATKQQNQQQTLNNKMIKCS